MTALEYEATRAGGALSDDGEGDALPPGTAIGEYIVEARLGSGAFGAVYRAHHPVLGRDVAIKILHRAVSSNEDIVGRFLAEARAVNQIRHRNIIDIFGFGKLDDGRQYYVMECLDGEPLDETLKRRGALPASEALPILRAIARALEAAHGHGIVHRDLKAENVFLARDGDGAFPKLLDFGIAKLLSSGPQAASRTRSGIQVGTPYAMAPEQCRGVAVDGRADVYALGVLTHRMLTGELPFDGETAMDIILKHMTEKPPPMSTVARGIPHVLDRPVLKMLEKDPNDRFGRPGEAIEALERAAAHAWPELASASTSSSGTTRLSTAHGPTTLRAAAIAAVKRRSPRIFYAVETVALLVAAAALWHTSRTAGPVADADAVAEVDAARITRPAEAVAPMEPPSAVAAPVNVALTISVTPPTAAILIDGVASGEGTATVSRPRGSHARVEVREASFVTRTEDLTLAESVRLEWVLERKPATSVPAARPRPARKPEGERRVHSDLVNPLD